MCIAVHHMYCMPHGKGWLPRKGAHMPVMGSVMGSYAQHSAFQVSNPNRRACTAHGLNGHSHTNPLYCHHGVLVVAVHGVSCSQLPQQGPQEVFGADQAVPEGIRSQAPWHGCVCSSILCKTLRWCAQTAHQMGQGGTCCVYLTVRDYNSI